MTVDRDFLAAGIFVALLAIIALLVLNILRRPRGYDVAAHNKRVAAALNSDGFKQELRRSILLEAALAAQIEAEFESLAGLDDSELGLMLSQAGYKTDLDIVINKLRGIFSRENAKALGDKLFDKILGIANKAMGFG